MAKLFVLALIFLDTINVPHTQSVIMTDNGKRSEMLFNIIHRFWDQLPNELKRKKKYSTKQQIEFEEIGSIISVGTAGTDNVGRGGTIQNLLESERAVWVNGDYIETGLLQSVPKNGNIWKETTANGYNEYKIERDKEWADPPKSAFRPRFFSFKHHREYTEPVPDDFRRSPDEEAFAAMHGLTDGQLMWSTRSRKAWPFCTQATHILTRSGSPCCSTSWRNQSTTRYKGLFSTSSIIRYCDLCTPMARCASGDCLMMITTT